MRRVLSAVGAILLGLVGVATALLGLFVSRSTVDVLGVSVPYGLPLALAGAAGLVVAGRVLLGFVGAAAAAAGWVVGLGLVLWPRPAGDVLVGEDGYGIGFCLLGLLIIGVLAYRARTAGSRSSG